MQTAQQFGAASTYGKKYALGNLLLIDDTEDADSGQKPSKAIDKIKAAAKPAITADQMKKAKEYITAGGDVTAIHKKYKLNANQTRELNGQSKDTKEA
jgi:lipopolysaccharide assembly outer membrane protein LptD (OstA)